MNNYSWLQRKTHTLALSLQMIREVTFDVEMAYIPKITDADDHVFIAGLARSGTTALLNAIFASDEFSSLSYEDMPFVLAPNLWSKSAKARKHGVPVERAHGDGVYISTDSPEAFEEVFWRTFDDKKVGSIEKFKGYINAVITKGGRPRYLSKNNQNIVRLHLLHKFFPRSNIIIPFRDPAQHTLSLYNQHVRFIELSKSDPFVGHYMKLIGHREFGPEYIPFYADNLKFPDPKCLNHWLEQWIRVYQSILESQQRAENCIYICYESLCDGEKDVWTKLKQQLRINKSYEVTFMESIKPVNFDFDSNLLIKSQELYSSLLNFSKC